LLGKTPAPRRKKSQKSQSEVEILEARLETIESAYTERLNQMEQLLNSVMPSHGQVPIAETASNNLKGSASPGSSGNVNLHQHTSLTDDKDWTAVPTTNDSPQSAPRTWSQSQSNATVPMVRKDAQKGAGKNLGRIKENGVNMVPSNHIVLLLLRYRHHSLQAL